MYRYIVFINALHKKTAAYKKMNSSKKLLFI